MQFVDLCDNLFFIIRSGLEVLSIKSGVPITSMSLNKGQSYADIDGDGIVDSMLVIETEADSLAHGKAFGHDAGDMQPCMVMVVSGLPARL